MKERLQKVIAAAGVCSRREAERLIEAGDVSVNGHTVRKLGTSVDPATDHVEVRGRKIRASRPPLYLALHKPRGCVTTARDPEGRKTVLDLLAGVKERVFPVGRLDYSAEGLLLMTNDGDLAYALMRPGGVAKTYRVKVKGAPTLDSIETLRRGLHLDGAPLLPAAVRVESRGDTSWIRVTLHEGKRNQIIRMMDAIGHPVRRLRRVSIGPLQLAALPVGRWRALEPEEVGELKRAAGIRVASDDRRSFRTSRSNVRERAVARGRSRKRETEGPGQASRRRSQSGPPPTERKRRAR